MWEHQSQVILNVYGIKFYGVYFSVVWEHHNFKCMDNLMLWNS